MNNPVYVVKDGDTLWDIAQNELGDGSRYHEIVDLNKSVLGNSNDIIHPETQLKLPADAKIAKPPAPVYGTIPSESVSKEADNSEPFFSEGMSKNRSSVELLVPCQQEVPCCLTSIKLKCSHGQVLELPQNEKKKRYLVLVADQGLRGNLFGRCVDRIDIEIKKKECPSGKTDPSTKSKYPLVQLKSIDDQATVVLQSGVKQSLFISQEVSLIDSFEYFFDNFWFLDKSRKMARHYTLSCQMCEGDTSPFGADIYVYPKIKWDGTILFGYGLEEVEFNRNVRREYSREENKKTNKAYKKLNKKTKKAPKSELMRTSEVPTEADDHKFSVKPSLTLWLGDKYHSLSLPLKKSMTRQSGWGGRLITQVFDCKL